MQEAIKTSVELPSTEATDVLTEIPREGVQTLLADTLCVSFHGLSTGQKFLF
ncbi:MAG: hypothetical protein H6821_13215 [Planctomycetaceae bacterium]|nr:hypothetical protein [Planctomycetales bacterium]MCB9875131.1 hypothetical protein [Planctomycetaceae bacterium]MCB9941625.1 hypothetical protein [Planctomycetaceae bacterium]HRX79529.1 hypothetical protein [Pirellulaceae bacterium]